MSDGDEGDDKEKKEKKSSSDCCTTLTKYDTMKCAAHARRVYCLVFTLIRGSEKVTESLLKNC